jgi:hypothetical protein
MSIARIRDAILAGASGEELSSIPLPDDVHGAMVFAHEVDLFEGLSSQDKDPRKSVHVAPYPLPPLAPDEAYVAVMASSIHCRPFDSSSGTAARASGAAATICRTTCSVPTARVSSCAPVPPCASSAPATR